MTFPLDFDLLTIEVCTFIQGKKKEKKTNKKNKKQKNKKKKKKKKKRKKRKKKRKKKKKKKRKCTKICLCLISYSIDFFVVGFISGGLSEIFMRDELRESSLRSFVPCSSND